MWSLRKGRFLRYKGISLAQTFQQNLQAQCYEGKGCSKRHSLQSERMLALPQIGSCTESRLMRTVFEVYDNIYRIWKFIAHWSKCAFSLFKKQFANRENRLWRFPLAGRGFALCFAKCSDPDRFRELHARVWLLSMLLNHSQIAFK